MRRLVLVAVALLALNGATEADAEAATEAVTEADVMSLPGREGGAVAEVTGGDSLVLTSGEAVQLVGIRASGPMAEEARSTLAALAKGRVFRLHFGGARSDRHGRTLAHLVDADGFWLQGEMLRLGMARVRTLADNKALAERMLALERVARARRFGIWSHPFYRVRTPEELNGDIGEFRLVEGRIMQASLVRRTTYLNFGEDWRSDFTVMIPSGARKSFGVDDPANWTGRRIRVRGWLTRRNGPMLEVDHKEQIERQPKE